MVIDADGPRCQGNCPNRGCVEALASGTAIAREGARGRGAPDSALGRALAGGDEIDRQDGHRRGARRATRSRVEIVAGIGRHLGVALSSFANIFDPDVIVIGGGASRAGELLLEPARRELRSRALPPMNETPVRGGRARPGGRDDRAPADDGASKASCD